MTPLITAGQLRVFAMKADPVAWAPALDQAARDADIVRPRPLACWLGQLHVECQGFSVFEENLHYRTPARLNALFSAVDTDEEAAELIRRGPAAIANRVYANRNGNGDEASGDGWRFRGMGPIQLTGRRMYAKASTWTGLDLVGDPQLVLKPAIGAKVAADYWRVCALNDEAERLDVREITRAINPALAGLAERKAQTERALTIWGGR